MYLSYRVYSPPLIYFFFFSFIFIIWRLITSQHCSGFGHTLTWISHGVTCIPHPDPPSHLPLHPIPLGLPSAPGPSTLLSNLPKNLVFVIVLAFVNILIHFFLLKILSVFQSIVSGNDICSWGLWSTNWFWFSTLCDIPLCYQREKVLSPGISVSGDHSISTSSWIHLKPFSLKSRNIILLLESFSCCALPLCGSL